MKSRESVILDCTFYWSNYTKVKLGEKNRWCAYLFNSVLLDMLDIRAFRCNQFLWQGLVLHDVYVADKSENHMLREKVNRRQGCHSAVII